MEPKGNGGCEESLRRKANRNVRRNGRHKENEELWDLRGMEDARRVGDVRQIET